MDYGVRNFDEGNWKEVLSIKINGGKVYRKSLKSGSYVYLVNIGSLGLLAYPSILNPAKEDVVLKFLYTVDFERAVKLESG